MRFQGLTNKDGAERVVSWTHAAGNLRPNEYRCLLLSNGPDPQCEHSTTVTAKFGSGQLFTVLRTAKQQEVLCDNNMSNRKKPKDLTKILLEVG